MMKPRFLPQSVAIGTSLVLFVALVAACVPATSMPASPPTVEPSIASSPTPFTEVTPSVDLTATYTLELLSATPPSDGQPVGVATSRGPSLEATDPGMVNLASGGLQLVEFFRFT